MKTFNPLVRCLLTAIMMCQGGTIYAATQVTVNSTNNTEVADSELTLTEAIGILNGGFRTLSAAESNQVATIAGATNRIKFAIAGAGPHYIKAPDETDPTLPLFPAILASDVIVDGYSQPGSFPNTNSILGSNTAVLKIVIDSRTSVNSDGVATLAAIGNNVNFRGLSFLGGANCIGFGSAGDPGTWPNVGGSIQGCWIGVDPDRTTVAAPDIGTYLYQSGGFQVIGTDGDGVNDRNEFNVFVGCQEMAIGIEADGYGTTNCRVSGNFIGVMPDGHSAMPASALASVFEGDGLESGGTDNLIFGTDSNGIADEDERNIVGGLTRGIPQNGCEALQFWGTTTHVKVMGNYFGVAIDGVTPLSNTRFMNVEDGSTVQIGSDGDGVRDDLEANIIANHSDYVFGFGGPNTALIFPHNSFFNNTADFFTDPIDSFNGYRLSSSDLAVISPVISNSTTRAELIGWVPVSTNAINNQTAAEISIYEADPVTSATKPQGKKWLATYVDNGPEDLDAATNVFRFNICALPISSTGAKITVNETVFDDFGGGSSPFATPLSLPDVSNALTISQPSPTSVSLSWQMNGVLQANPSLTSGTWTNVPGCSAVTLSVGSGPLFFRVKQ